MAVTFPWPRQVSGVTAPFEPESSSRQQLMRFATAATIPSRAARSRRVLFEFAERPPPSMPVVLKLCIRAKICISHHLLQLLRTFSRSLYHWHFSNYRPW
ncbi:hypothetical protein Y032_0045g1226 [Ancylostoma ceylanicum]|uniref:Uncharacterized protein n=1 Tax=Ancylostoma ceylanicum TaxID=53326 RepID=A0A016UCL1_9BILA|nr:hypothetical protein Y032_0045g1226 [Ancylostoma ceylanicum]